MQARPGYSIRHYAPNLVGGLEAHLDLAHTLVGMRVQSGATHIGPFHPLVHMGAWFGEHPSMDQVSSQPGHCAFWYM